jgi:exosortase
MKKELTEIDLTEKHLALAGLALTLAIAFCFGETLIDLVKRWNIDPNYSHGFIIPAMSGYLFWKKKDAFNLSAIQPELRGLPVFLLGLLLLVLGKAGGLNFVMYISFLVVFLGLFLFMLGTTITRSLLFPIGFLVFMIPLPYVLYTGLTLRLKLLTSIITAKFMIFIGIPALREGNIIHLDQASLEVIDACSGMRSLMSLLAVAVFYAYLTHRSIWLKLSLILVTIPIAIFSNVCRLTLTAILVDNFGPKAIEGVFHVFSGVLVFAIGFTLLVLCSFLLKRIKI